MNDIYSSVAETIIANLEAAGSWQKLWQVPSPVNITGRFYNGINTLILASSLYTSRVFATYKQIRQNGGQVRKSEKGTTVVFWKISLYEDKVSLEEKKSFLLRFYTVFNSEQADFDDEGNQKIACLNDMVANRMNQRQTKAEDIIGGMPSPPHIINTSSDDKAYYSPSQDLVHVPDIACFESSDQYYQVMFHELIHSTGHHTRLDRFPDESKYFGNMEYSKEELVAELGSSYLTVISGCKWNQRNSAAYIASWASKLRDNKQWIVWAATRAEKASNFILDIKDEKAPVLTVPAEIAK